ncbi:unnamed protein product [Heterobilharzia americana]|nr:unnamed protein product [Heterobilharzia americana]
MAFGRFCDPANLSANELVGVANNALSVINVDPYIRSIHDITPTFVLDLSVVLFGSDVLPCPDSVDADCVENFEAVVSKLSHEIGEDLDHILPEELMVGEPQALFDFLVLLCAFIVYCGEMDLLKLHGLGNLETKEYPEFQLSTSPELPRHSVVCAPTTLSSSFHQSDRFMEQSTPLKRTPASFQTRNSLHPGDSMNSLLKTNLFTFQPDNMKTNHPIASCLPSLLDIHANSSPPATPNAMNAYLEISLVPSLKNSPNIQQQVIRSSSVDKFEETNKPTSPVTDSSKDLFGSKNSIISMDSVCVNVSTAPPHVRSSAHEHKVRLSTPPDRDNGNNISVSSSIELVHKSISDKHDSSSSGRGRSLTATQTVPCQSNGSVPSSLLELHTFPGSPNTSHAVVISQSIQENIPLMIKSMAVVALAAIVILLEQVVF